MKKYTLLFTFLALAEARRSTTAPAPPTPKKEQEVTLRWGLPTILERHEEKKNCMEEVTQVKHVLKEKKKDPNAPVGRRGRPLMFGVSTIEELEEMMDGLE